jgi:hypothetical protein
MLARFLEAERLLFLVAFLAFLSASDEELLDEDPVRAGAAASATGASVSRGLVASMLFLGAEGVAPASAVGLPTREVSGAGLIDV